MSSSLDKGHNALTIKQLYDRDYNLWLAQMAIALKNKNTEAMDWENLIEEIEDLRASQKIALRSYIQRLIEHILKLNYWHSEPERCGSSLRLEIANFRGQIANILEDSPSLTNYLQQNYLDWFEKLVKRLKATKTFDLSNCK